MQSIASTNNEKVKFLRSLGTKKGRKEENCYIIEGATIVKDIPIDKVKIHSCYIKESLLEKNISPAERLGVEPILLKDFVFDSVSDTVSPSGIIAVAYTPPARPIEGDKALLLCGISDCGNLGTIYRTAAARGITEVITVDCADSFSSKTVRASMGGLFHINVSALSKEEAISELRDYSIIALDSGGKSIYSYKKEGKVALAVGSEAHGLPEWVTENASEILSIPMVKASVESLNAAVSISIGMYLLF